MGYVCPVCEDPQADGEHLANHLAFTAMLGDDAHEAWLDEHAPDWGQLGPTELAERVTDDAAETEYPQVFEDTTGDALSHEGHDHGSGRGQQHAREHRGPAGAGGSLDGAPGGVADVADALATDDVDLNPDDVLAEARELTRRRRASTDADSDQERTDSNGERTDDGGDSGTDAEADDETASDE